MWHITNSIHSLLKNSLIRERNKILDENIGFKMLGKNFVLSDATIEDLCLKAPFIQSKDDFKDVLSLHPEYHDRLFHVMWDI